MLNIEEIMKKSNKLTFFYCLASVALFLSLLIGGGYGIYVSVGLNFARSSVPNIAENGMASNVSIIGNMNYTPSMTGVIILSMILIVLAIFDFIVLIKQIVFFKQFKIIKNSKLEKDIEKKTKSKGSVIFWTIFIDILSVAAGIAGICINNRSFAGKSNFSWVFYAVDIAVSVLAFLSIILLIAKLKNKTNLSEKDNNKQRKNQSNHTTKTKKTYRVNPRDINQMEYNLIKLEALKKGKMVSEDEYKKLRKQVLKFDFSENFSEKTETDY